jgi:hypothetical protein
MRDHRQPTPPLSWDSEPDFLADGAAFEAMPMASQQYVAKHWFWCMEESQIHGRGLVSHHNYLKMLVAEDAAEEHSEIVLPGVTVNGEITYRNEW